MKSVTLSLMAFAILSFGGAIRAQAQTAQTTPLMDEVLSLLQNKMAASNGQLNCTDGNGKAMSMTLRPNSYVASFNYNSASDNTQNIPMPQNIQFGAFTAVSVSLAASTATTQTIVVVGKYRGNALTDFADSPQDGDRQKTTTLQVSVAADGSLSLASVAVAEVTYYQQVDAEK